MRNIETILYRRKQRLNQMHEVAVKVVMTLKDVTFFEMYNNIRCASSEDFKQFFNDDTSYVNIAAIAEFISMQPFWEEAYFSIPDSHPIKSDFENYKGRKILEAIYNEDDIVAQTYCWWGFFKMFFDNPMFETIVDTPTKVTEKDLTDINESIMYYFDNNSCFFDSSSENAIINLENRLFEYKENIEKRNIEGVIENFNSNYLITISSNLGMLEYVFLFINIPCLNLSRRNNIVRYLRTTKFRFFIQKAYNEFRIKYPAAKDWKFCNTRISSRIELPQSNEPKCVPSNQVGVGNYIKETLGISRFVESFFTKCGDKDAKYRKTLECLYDKCFAVPFAGDKKLINCSKIDFIYLLGAKLYSGEEVSDNPVINWTGEKLVTMRAFFYALYYTNKKKNGDLELANGITRCCKKLCYCYKGESVQLTLEKKQNTGPEMNTWRERIAEIANKLVLL